MFTFFSKLGVWMKRAFRLVQEVVPDEMLLMAVLWARVAAEKFTDNAKRREFVVQMLMARGIPESIARLAVELAVQFIKRELREATS